MITMLAKAAFIKAGTGCSWNGNTDVTLLAEGYGEKPTNVSDKKYYAQTLLISILRW